MRFAVSLGWCGYSLDFILGPAEDDEPEVEHDRRGDCLSQPVGFTRSADPEWEDPGSYHQFDPSEAAEDV